MIVKSYRPGVSGDQSFATLQVDISYFQGGIARDLFKFKPLFVVLSLCTSTVTFKSNHTRHVIRVQSFSMTTITATVSGEIVASKTRTWSVTTFYQLQSRQQLMMGIRWQLDRVRLLSDWNGFKVIITSNLFVITPWKSQNGCCRLQSRLYLTDQKWEKPQNITTAK